MHSDPKLRTETQTQVATGPKQRRHDRPGHIPPHCMGGLQDAARLSGSVWVQGFFSRVLGITQECLGLEFP